MEEYGIFEKLDVIKRSSGPLFKALRKYADATKKTVDVIGILDNCSPDVERVYAYCVNQCGIPMKIEKHSNPIGNAGTFRRQCEIAKTCGDREIAFFLEDDYLVVNPDVFMIIEQLFEKHGVDGVNPHWHPRSGAGIKGQTVDSLDVNGIKFGRIDNSCCTFAVRSQVLKDNESMFLKYCGQCREGDSFNNVWKSAKFYGVYGDTLMEHMHKCDFSGVFDLGAYKRK